MFHLQELSKNAHLPMHIITWLISLNKNIDATGGLVRLVKYISSTSLCDILLYGALLACLGFILPYLPISDLKNNSLL